MVKVAIFSSTHFLREFLDANPQIQASLPNLEFQFFHTRLNADTAKLASGADAVCIFVNDKCDADALQVLHKQGIRCVLLRCAGFNNVDLNVASKLGINVVRVPAYSPHAVAEFAVALLLTVVRKTHKAYNRTRESNFALRGLMGFDLHGKTVGVIGTGKIGRIFAGIMKNGFGTRVIAYDIYPSQEAKDMGVEYVSLDDLYKQADVISLHCPSLPSTKHMINEAAIKRMKTGVVLVNTSRGELVNMNALIDGIKKKVIGACAMDVIEGEAELFFSDRTGEIIDDDRISTLLSIPNVVITPHVAFCTDTAMDNIWTTTMNNLKEFLEYQKNDKTKIHNLVLPAEGN